MSNDSNTARDRQVTPAPPSKNDADPALWLEEHGDYLFRYAYLRINSQETAEDLVQETLLAAVRSVKNFEGRSTIRTYRCRLQGFRSSLFAHFFGGNR